jgi:hypothetical protein
VPHLNQPHELKRINLILLSEVVFVFVPLYRLGLNRLLPSLLHLAVPHRKHVDVELRPHPHAAHDRQQQQRKIELVVVPCDYGHRQTRELDKHNGHFVADASSHGPFLAELLAGLVQYPKMLLHDVGVGG